MLHSVVRLSRVSPGFDTTNVLSFRLSLTGSSYTDGASRVAFVRQFIDRIAAAPGIQRVGLTSNIPFGGSRGANGVEIEGRPDHARRIDHHRSTLHHARLLSDDARPARSAAACSRSNRRRAGGTRRDDQSHDGATLLSCVIADRPSGSRDGWLGRRRLVPHRRRRRGRASHFSQPGCGSGDVLSVRAGARRNLHRRRPDGGNPAVATPAFREALRAADPALPMYDIRTMEDRIARSMAQTRATMLLLLVTASARGGAGRDRHLRVGLVFGQHADSGNRHPAGARCDTRVGLRVEFFATPCRSAPSAPVIGAIAMSDRTASARKLSVRDTHDRCRHVRVGYRRAVRRHRRSRASCRRGGRCTWTRSSLYETSRYVPLFAWRSNANPIAL